MNSFRLKLGSILAAMLAAFVAPAQDYDTPNKARDQIGLTRNPNMHSREEIFDNGGLREGPITRDEPQMDEGARRQIERTARSLTRRFLDQWRRYDDLKKKIADEKAKPRNERDRKAIGEWEKELEEVKKENETQRNNFDNASDEVKDKVREQIREEKRQEAQNAENEKAKAEGREPQTITNPPMPYGNPPNLP
jgi:hypothetical protein